MFIMNNNGCREQNQSYLADVQFEIIEGDEVLYIHALRQIVYWAFKDRTTNAFCDMRFHDQTKAIRLLSHLMFGNLMWHT